MSQTFYPTKTLILSFLLLFTFTLQAEAFKTVRIDTTKTDTTEVKKEILPDSLSNEPQEVMIFWTKKNAVGMNFNEVAFVNWNAGGNNSISALFHGNFERKYSKKLLSWKSNASLRYGLNAQEGRELRKSEDQIQVGSTFGYRRDSVSNFRYSAKFNFNTQFANGYRYPDTRRPISKFMAPAYIFLGIGTEYSHPKEDLTVYISPVTQKSTFVLDRVLSNEGMFGVSPAIKDEEGNILEEGERVRTEVGVLVTSGFTKEVFSNVNLDNQISLYSDYLNKFGNVDVDWQMNVNMVVNTFIKASIGSHLRYDDDVKVREDINGDGELETLGPKIQFKQMLGVGVVYEF